MGDWRRAVVVGEEVWYNIKTREVTSHRPNNYHSTPEGRDDSIVEPDAVAEMTPLEDEPREDRARGSLKLPKEVRVPRQGHIIRLGPGPRPRSHRIGDDPLKFHQPSHANPPR